MQVDDLLVAIDADVKGARVPRRGTVGAAGYDLFAPQDFVLGPGLSIKINTGVIVELPKGTYGRSLLKFVTLTDVQTRIADRSSLMVKDIRTSGVIDPDYRGPIKVYLFNHGSQCLTFKEGDGIAQMIIEPCKTPETRLVLRDELSKTDRGTGGFGSTNKKTRPDSPIFFY